MTRIRPCSQITKLTLRRTTAADDSNLISSAFWCTTQYQFHDMRRCLSARGIYCSVRKLRGVPPTGGNARLLSEAQADFAKRKRHDKFPEPALIDVLQYYSTVQIFLPGMCVQSRKPESLRLLQREAPRKRSKGGSEGATEEEARTPKAAGGAGSVMYCTWMRTNCVQPTTSQT